MIEVIDYIDIRIKSCELLMVEHFKLSKTANCDESRIRCEVIADCYKREVETLHIIRRLLKAKLNTSDETIKGGDTNG